MIVSRRKRADRLSSAALVCLAAGLCGAAWLALKPPAPEERSRAPAAPPSVTASAPVAPAAENLSILWLGANDVSAASGRPSSPAAGAGLPALGAEAPPFTIRGTIASSSGSFSFAFVQSASGVSMIRQGEAAEGWKLTGVTENTATFAREDRAVTLSLAKPEYDAASGGALASAGAGPSPASRFPQPVARGTVQLPPNPQPAGNPSSSAGSTAVGSATVKTVEVAVPQSLVDSVRAAMAPVGVVRVEPN